LSSFGATTTSEIELQAKSAISTYHTEFLAKKINGNKQVVGLEKKEKKHPWDSLEKFPELCCDKGEYGKTRESRRD